MSRIGDFANKIYGVLPGRGMLVVGAGNGAQEPSQKDRILLSKRDFLRLLAASGASVALSAIPALAQDDTKAPKELKDVKPVPGTEAKPKRIANETEVRELLAAYKKIKPEIMKVFDPDKGPYAHEFLLLQNIRRHEDTSQLPKELREELEKEIEFDRTGNGTLNIAATELKVLKIYLKGEREDNAKIDQRYKNALKEARRLGKTEDEVFEIDEAFISLTDSSKFTIKYYEVFIEMMEYAYGIYPKTKDLGKAKENYEKYIGKVNLDNRRLLIGRKSLHGEPTMQYMLEKFLKDFKAYMSEKGEPLS